MRTFEFREGKSAKFWSIEVKGATVTTRWGRIDTTGQEKVETFDTPAIAKAAANKQMAAKLAKDYRETGARTKPVKLAAPKPVGKAKPVVSKVKPAKVKPQNLPKDVDELFARGFPHLRRLAPPLGKGVATAVKKELAAGDPDFGVDVPQDVAAAFLSAMAFSRAQAAEREAAIKTPAPIDRALLDTVLGRLAAGMSEIYSFRILDAVWLFEAFLGTEVVAEAIVAHVVNIQSSNENDHVFDLIDALGYMRWRMPSVRWTAITKPLSSVKKGLVGKRLGLLLDPSRPVTGEQLRGKTTEIALQRGDAATLRTAHSGSAYWYSARFAYLVGDKHFDKVDYAELRRLPKWLQRQVVAQFGLLHGPHIDKIRETLERAVKKSISIRQAKKKIDESMAELEKWLLRANGDQTKETTILRNTFRTYCEARADAGEISPDTFFMHCLAEVKWKKTSPVQRWLDIAMEVVG
jgi:predicted DNA-binding WGR domain protein